MSRSGSLVPSPLLVASTLTLSPCLDLTTQSCAPLVLLTLDLKSHPKPAQAQRMCVYQKRTSYNTAFFSGESIEFRVRHAWDPRSSLLLTSYVMLGSWVSILRPQFSFKMKMRRVTPRLCENVFIQWMFIEQRLCARHGSNFLGYVRKERSLTLGSYLPRR